MRRNRLVMISFGNANKSLKVALRVTELFLQFLLGLLREAETP